MEREPVKIEVMKIFQTAFEKAVKDFNLTIIEIKEYSNESFVYHIKDDVDAEIFYRLGKRYSKYRDEI